MTDIAPGQIWELFSESEGRWVRAVVIKVENDQVILRYEGLMEFVVVSLADMKTTPTSSGAQAPPRRLKRGTATRRSAPD